LFLHRFEQELYNHVDAIEHGAPKVADKARAIIRDNLTQLSQILTKQKFLLGDEFSMLDVAIAPLLWRLDRYNIQMGKDAAPMMKYAERLFSRQGFIDALTSAERAMRK
jgi:RNA polymerase-associated protein